MRNNETGEFELVLGNKQLLGGFFIVVILFCVFFSMGYILGRNSAPVSRAAGEPATASPPVTEQAPPTVQQPAPAPSEQPRPAEAGAPAAEAPQAGSQPAKEPPAVATPAAEQAASADPVPGETYLQVMAVKRQEAEVVVKTLKDKGFPALMGPGPNELVRVLVGPYRDGTSLGQAKAGLEKAGFQPIVKKG